MKFLNSKPVVLSCVPSLQPEGQTLDCRVTGPLPAQLPILDPWISRAHFPSLPIWGSGASRAFPGSGLGAQPQRRIGRALRRRALPRSVSAVQHLKVLILSRLGGLLSPARLVILVTTVGYALRDGPRWMPALPSGTRVRLE